MPSRQAEPSEAEKNRMAASHPGLYKPGPLAFIIPALLILVFVFAGLLGGVALWIVAPAIMAVLVVAMLLRSLNKRNRP
jgi:Flp pilus assembly protein TadB